MTKWSKSFECKGKVEGSSTTDNKTLDRSCCSIKIFE